MEPTILNPVAKWPLMLNTKRMSGVEREEEGDQNQGKEGKREREWGDNKRESEEKGGREGGIERYFMIIGMCACSCS
jgi:hypothetical protein